MLIFLIFIATLGTLKILAVNNPEIVQVALTDSKGIKFSKANLHIEIIDSLRNSPVEKFAVLVETDGLKKKLFTDEKGFVQSQVSFRDSIVIRCQNKEKFQKEFHVMPDRQNPEKPAEIHFIVAINDNARTNSTFRGQIKDQFVVWGARK